MDNIGPLIKKLKARLRAVEPDSRGYQSQNKETNALGMYQFVPKYHWNKIKNFAIRNGYGSANEINHNFFLKNPELQEEYFAEYVEKDIVPELNKARGYNNVRNLDIDEIAQLVHYRPGSVKRYLEGGNFVLPEGVKNLNVEEYLVRGEQGLAQNNLGFLKPAELMSPEEIKSNVDQYMKDSSLLKKKLDKGDIKQGAFDIQMRKLQREYSSKGLTPNINNELIKGKADRSIEFEKLKGESKELYNILASEEKGKTSSVFESSDFPFRKEYDQDKKRLTLKGRKSDIEKFAKKYGFRQDRGLQRESGLSSDGRRIQTKDNPNAKLNSVTFSLEGKGPNSKKLLEEINKYQSKPVTFGDLERSSGLGEQYEQNFLKPLDFDKKYTEDEFNYIDESKVAYSNPKDYTESKPNETEGQKKKEIQEKVETQKAAPVSSEQATTVEDLTFGIGEIEQENLAEYNPDNFKKEIPFGAAVQGFLAMQGMAAADNEIPMRDEEIGVGFENYIRELQEITRLGLPPELEAKAKNDLAGAYQVGMQNIVAASGGNRNAVLGNQSQLDLANMNASQNLRVKDFEAKVNAVNKYGEAMKYVNEFNANRDIANKQLEQNLAFQDRQAGGMLAERGFTNMIKSIQDQKERAPGTPYHMLMSKMSMDAFGVIPDMVDDGTGKRGTRSGLEAQKSLINQENEYRNSYKSAVAGFDQDKINLMGEFNKRTGDWEQRSKFADMLTTNTANNINLDNYDQAMSNDDYSFFMQNKPEQAPAPEQNTPLMGFKPFL